MCQRCGCWYNRDTLRNQFDWRGAAMLPLNIYVCPSCYDTPQPQLRAIVVQADPVPVYWPLTEPFEQDETDFHTVAGPAATDPTTGIPVPIATTFLTQDGRPVTELPYGEPTGLEQDAVMPLYGATHYGAPLALLSVTASGSDQIAVTCSAAHGLATDGQVAVEGLSDARACGFFSIAVSTATAFTYQTRDLIAAASLLTPTARIVAALVGLPRGYTQIPQV